MARYARLVESALTEIPDFSSRFELSTLRLAIPWGNRNRFPRSIETWFNHFWLMARGGATIRRHSPDLVHLLDGSHGYLLNQLQGMQLVATVHDLIPLLQQREAFGPDRTSFLSRWLVGRCITGLKRAQVLIAVSACTRRDLAAFAQIATEETSVIPNALDPEFLTIAANGSAGARTRIPAGEAIVLHVGNNGQYKNRAGVLRIFSRLIQTTNARLKLAGPTPSTSLLRLIKNLGLDKHVDIVGPVDDRQLCELYQSASVLLFPSLYEGFGWPPLEAMACGCPVVCSGEGSLAEVVGEAALTAPAHDEAQLARLCIRVLQEAGVAEALRTRGHAHVQQFTLQRMGEEMLALYEQALDASPNLSAHSRSLAARSGA